MACSVFHRSPLAIVVFRIRRGLLETQSFKTLKQKQISRNQECLLYLNIILKSVLFLTAGGTLAFILTPPIYRNI